MVAYGRPGSVALLLSDDTGEGSLETAAVLLAQGEHAPPLHVLVPLEAQSIRSSALFFCLMWLLA